MRNTTRWAIPYPEGTDVPQAAVDMGNIAQRVDNVLSTAIVAADGSSYPATPNEGLLVYRLDVGSLFIYHSGAWVKVTLPFAMAAGNVNAPFSASATATVAGTFPAGRFTQTPLITFGIGNPAPSGMSYPRISPISTSGFTLFVNNAAAVTATAAFNYMAVQMTPTAAAG
jgi:hypothetical protein